MGLGLSEGLDVVGGCQMAEAADVEMLNTLSKWLTARLFFDWIFWIVWKGR